MKNNKDCSKDNYTSDETNYTTKNIKETRYIVPVVSIVSASIVVIAVAISITIASLIKENLRSNVRLDKVTYCMQTIMEQSTKAGKHLDAKSAKEICKDVEVR